MSASVEEKTVRNQSHGLTVEDLKDFSTVTVIRKNWGTPGCPAGKRDYLIPVEFIGGVARNVPIAIAEQWLKAPIMRGLIYVLPPDAKEGDFMRVTGMQPMEVETFAAMLKGYDPEQLLNALGEEELLALAARMKDLVEGKSHPAPNAALTKKK